MGHDEMNRQRANAIRLRAPTILLWSLFWFSGAATAQEIGSVWASEWAFNGPHYTERAVQQDMESLHSASLPHGPFSFEITKQTVLDDRTIYQYEFERVPPVVGEWSHKSLLDPPQPNATLQTVMNQIKQRLDGQSTGQGCPASTVVTVSPNWQVDSSWDNGQSINESTSYTATYSVGSPGNCSSTSENSSILRNRSIQCPNVTVHAWSNAKQACAGVPGSEMTYFSAPARACPSEEGCQPSSGAKNEATLDFDLGWVSFQRSYHSGGSAAGGGFGGGWTHSHNIRLAIGTHPASGNATLHYGLIEGSGAHIAFKPAGAVYEAADGSGDRLVANGTQWTLYRGDRVLAFDSEGRLLSQRYDDGTALSYGYDTLKRLATITHSNGRALDFAYASGKGAAPVASISSGGTVLASYGYTSLGQVQTATYAGGAQLVYHYGMNNAPMLLTGVTAEDGRRHSTYTYDAKGRVEYSELQGAGAGLLLEYTPTGTAKATNALGRLNTYALTSTPASGAPRKVASVANSAGTLSYTYYPESTDFRRRLDTVTDRNGTVTKHTYLDTTDTASGLLVRVQTTVEAQGTAQARTTEQRYERDANRLIMARVGSRETRIARNSRQQPTSVTERDAVTNATRITTYAYCEAADVAVSNSTCPLLGLPKSVNGPRTDVSDVTTYTYYSGNAAGCASSPSTCTYRKGDLWKTSNALGQVTEVLAYDAQGRALSVKDANGVVTDYEYHPRGWLTATKVRGTNNAVETDDLITRVDYFPTGLVQKITQPDGNWTGYEYDAAQRLTVVTDRSGWNIRYTLDAAGNRTVEDYKKSDGVMYATRSRVYNALGQLQTDKDGLNNATGYVYDADGRADTVTDALGRVTDPQYDPLGRLARTIEDVGAGRINADTHYLHNDLDLVTQVIDPKGLNTVYAYNGFGDLTQLTSPDTGITSYTYDSAGNRASQTDARSITATYSYDALGRITQQSYPTAALGSTYTYDTTATGCPAGETFAQGRLSQTSGTGGTTRYCYDRFGRMVRKTVQTTGPALVSLYAYTPAGALKSVTYPDGTLVDYVRSTHGQITQVGVTRPGQAREILVTAVGYFPYSPPAGWVYGNGRPMTRNINRNYDTYRLQGDAQDGISLFLHRDAVGNVIRQSTGDQATVFARYQYDALNRLLQTQDGPSAVPIETYGYDATGNRTSLLHAGVTTNYTYPAGNHRLAAVGTVARTYDAAGNTTAIGGVAKELVYNDLNRLSQVKANGVAQMNYAYNGQGQQVRRYNGSVIRHAMYLEDGRWLGEYDNAGVALQQVVWLDDLPVGLLNGAGTSQKLLYIEPDHLGSPRIVIDPSRNKAIWKWQLKGEAFGNSPPEQDPDQDGVAFVFDMRFPGQRYDSASGLNYNYFRDYDAGSGRYVQSDPIGLAGGIGTYIYVDGSPNSWVDPLGLQGVLVRPSVGRLGRLGRGVGYMSDATRVPWSQQPQVRVPVRGSKPKNDVPSWARGSVPRNGEKPSQFARRVCEEAGQSTKEGPGTPFNQIKKYAETHFRPDGKPPSLIGEILFGEGVEYYIIDDPT
ncbi:DUF6531 domain-containing protein [Lysobacter sp. 5GHs7-4]|uniref:RHS repeat-associated core domain-containing protein n=1 Tax=Lysobacter sp. 5GHs7-4 TaxID=2904253 RepID=UPI001E399355|nr:RHS repeat-associated core domain-containing protein [Lysobacter sp. 5GHs7-4]UHQ23024.1 DUF6531 domain-containing protein [Lysobacter sp. 5GHs7-4]